MFGALSKWILARYSKTIPFTNVIPSSRLGVLGEEIEGLDVGEGVSGGEEAFEVAHLGRGVAAHVDHGAGGEGEELAEEGLVAAFARRVNDDGGVGGGFERRGGWPARKAPWSSERLKGGATQLRRSLQ